MALSRRVSRRSAAVGAAWALGLGLAMTPSLALAQISAVIAANRTSGLAPLAVRFDATGSDCNGSGGAGQWNQDLEQCLYSWNFGDPGAPPYGYGAAALAGQARSANLAEGFIAGHVFESPGNYVVTLTIRNPNGQTATRTQTINVSAYSGSTHCISSSGAFSGCPSGSQQVTQSSFNSALNSCTNSGARRCLFRRGDTFSRGGEVNLPGGPGIVGSFGSGNRPVVTGAGVIIGGGTDWRIMDIDFNGPSISGATHRLVYRTRIRNTGSQSGISWWGTNLSNLYVVRSELDSTATAGGSIGYYVTAENQVVLGSSIGNSGDQSGGGGHNIRIGDMSRSVFASNDLGPARAGHMFKITGENSGSSGARHWILRDNVFRHDRGFNRSVSMVPQMDDNPGPVSGGLIEANYCLPQGTGGVDSQVCIYVVEMQDMVIRNNTADLTQRFGMAIEVNTGQDSWAEASNVSIMGNSAVWRTGSANDGGPAIRVASGTSNVRVANNLFYSAVSHPGSVVGCGGSACSLQANNLKVSANPFVGTTFEHPWRFRLQAGSAAVGAGSVRPESFFDLSGAVRTGSFDVGAWELGVATPPPPPVLLP